MSNNKRTTYAPRRRTTVPLTGTTTKPQALLDHKATLCLSYATGAVSKALGLTVPASGIARRALTLYGHQLDAMQPEQLQREAWAVRDHCKALAVPLEDTAAGLAMLDAEQLPSLGAVLQVGQQPVDWQAFDSQVDELIAALPKRRTTYPTKKEPTTP